VLAAATLGLHGAAAAGARLDISGEQRTRIETLDGQFRPALDARDLTLSLRTNVSFSAAWPRVRAVAEIMDSRAELNDRGSFLSTSVVNSLEPIQAFFAWSSERGKSESPTVNPAVSRAERAGSALTAGRMTIDLGSRRLVGRSRFRNTVNTFTGLDWTWRGLRGESVRAFIVSPTTRLPGSRAALLENAQRLDGSAHHTELSALFYERPVHALDDRLELYALRLDANEKDDARNLTTVGARLRRPASRGSWHYEIEAAAQSGSTKPGGAIGGVTLAQSAHLVHADVGFAFAGAWSPDLTVLYDYATGDADPDDGRDGRFDTLYGARAFDYGPTGIYGPFARSNLDTPGVRVTLSPGKRWRSMAEYRVLRLAEARDSWVGVGLLDASGASGRVLGRQIDARLSWDAIENRLGLETGFAYFSKGRFVDRTAPARSGPSTYLYAALTASF
jgi:hypothetical protein